MSDTTSDTVLNDDALRGAKAIARYTGEPERRTIYLLEKRLLPAGKIGNSWVASKRVLREHYERAMRGETA